MPGDFGGLLSAGRARLGRWRRRAASMSLADWSVFLTAALVNPVMYTLLRFRGARASSAVVERWSARQLDARRRLVTDDTIRTAKVISAWVNRGAAWPMPSVTCLARSLTGQLLLQRRGIAASLRIGVRPAHDSDRGSSGGLLFHAWIEVGGVPVNDVLDVGDRFLAFPMDEGLDAIVGAGA